MYSISLLQVSLGAALGLVTVNASPNNIYSRNDVLSCLDKCHVPYVTSSSANWTDFQTPFNLRLEYEPAVITIPENEEQVGQSVTCAAAAGLKVQPKSGGHSYASYSSGGQNGSLIVDLEKFGEITVDQSTWRL